MKEFENLKAIIGQIIHYQRIGKGWTQQQLANASGFKRTTISNIESGRQSLTVEQFCLIMSILDMKPSAALETANRRLLAKRHLVVEGVTSKLKERAIRKHVLETLK